MHPRFRAEVAVRVVPVDLHARAFDPCDLARGFLENLRPVALAFAIAQVHAQQHRRPILRFGAAASRLNIDKARIRIHRIVKHPAEFHVGNDALERRHVAGHGFERRVVALALCKLEQLGTVLQTRIEIDQPPDHIIELFFFLAELLRAFGIIPDLRILELPDDLGEPRRLHLEVKDTSANRRRAAGDRRVRSRSD